MHTLQKCVKIVQPFLTLYLPRAIPVSRKHKAALATTCPSQLYGTRIQKKKNRNDFCTCNCCCSHQMLLRHHSWELEAAAAVLLVVPYWGMGIIWSL